jgi:hypothetical protein
MRIGWVGLVVLALATAPAYAQHAGQGGGSHKSGGHGKSVTTTPPSVTTTPQSDDHPPMPPPPPSVGPCKMDLTGSVWLGHAHWSNGMDNDWWLQFKPNGVIGVGYWGEANDMGTWKQTGSSITFQFNDHFADYTGVMSLTEMSGTMTNIRNSNGDWNVSRECGRGVSS